MPVLAQNSSKLLKKYLIGSRADFTPRFLMAKVILQDLTPDTHLLFA
jgi:hypothetical protein